MFSPNDELTSSFYGIEFGKGEFKACGKTSKLAFRL